LDELFAKIDSGEIELTGDGGFIPGLIKATLERGLQAELTSHLGYEKGAPEASAVANSRNGMTPKTVATQTGEVVLAIPRDRDGTFTPVLVPKGSRRLSGLDEMIISLYAGGMTVRDIAHHLSSTIGTELSHETISNITDAIAEEILEWQARPLEAFYPVVYLDAIAVKVRDGAHMINKAAHIAVGVDLDGIKHVLGIWIQTAEVRGRGVRRARQPRRPRRAHRVLRRPHRPARGDRDDLGARDRADLRGPPDPGLDAVRVLQRPQGRGEGVEPDLHRQQRQDRPGRVRSVPRLELGQEVPPRRRDLGRRLGTVHPVPGVPARAATGDLHDQQHRVAELPAAQGHQEPQRAGGSSHGCPSRATDQKPQHAAGSHSSCS
jgi:hypothetical protein